MCKCCIIQLCFHESCNWKYLSHVVNNEEKIVDIKWLLNVTRVATLIGKMCRFCNWFFNFLVFALVILHDPTHPRLHLLHQILSDEMQISTVYVRHARSEDYGISRRICSVMRPLMLEIFTIGLYNLVPLPTAVPSVYRKNPWVWIMFGEKARLCVIHSVFTSCMSW